MSKKILFSFLLFFGCLSAAEARICFLPDVLGGDAECLGGMNFCTYTRQSPCNDDAYIESSCQRNGKTYYNCTCRNTGYKTDISTSGNTKYHCLQSYHDECGCAPENTVCNPNLYKYTAAECERNFTASVPTDGCFDPQSGVIKYKSCTCSSQVYPYSCSADSLVPNEDSKCTDSTGKTRYGSCFCNSTDNWGTTACTDRTDGCIQTNRRITSEGQTCYLCGPETCASGKMNLENYWCGVSSTSVTVSCKSLGYKQQSKCDDGTVGIRCPFDSSYMYCS